MPKLKECIELLQASTGGGVFTSENLTDIKFAEYVLASARAICIKELYQTRNNIHEIYYQYVELEYDESLQEDDCYTVFRYPVVLNINSQVDGHQYIGKRKGDNSWVRLKSLSHWQNFMKARPSRIADPTIYYVLEPQFGLVRVFNPNVKTAVGYSIFQDPLDKAIPFNRQLDQYPITPECLSLAEQYLREGKFQRYLQAPSNQVANGADDVNALSAPQ
jgi:hypothetical protein